MDKIISIYVKVERPDGTTFEQEVPVRKDETPDQAMARYQQEIGNPYAWRTENGRHIRYIKSGAYLCCNWRPKEVHHLYHVIVTEEYDNGTKKRIVLEGYAASKEDVLMKAASMYQPTAGIFRTFQAKEV